MKPNTMSGHKAIIKSQQDKIENQSSEKNNRNVPQNEKKTHPADKTQQEIEKDICVRCKKNKATITFTEGAIASIHGFKERICDDCYKKIMMDSNWFKEGYNLAKQEAEAKQKEFIEKLKIDLDDAQEDYAHLDWVSKEQISKIIDKLSQEVFGGSDE